jgi:hypothetical protein
VRGAIGLANGASASIQAGGKSVLTAATAGVIGSRYTLLDAGTVPLTIMVNGTQAAVPDVSLQAGADYTLLVWGSAGAVHTSLITDDNRLPTGGNAKLRLLNGMSTLGAPLTLVHGFLAAHRGDANGRGVRHHRGDQWLGPPVRHLQYFDGHAGAHPRQPDAAGKLRVHLLHD